MTDRQPKELSNAEWKIMKIVWHLGSCSAREVHEIAESRHGMTLGTVKTLLRRLMAKGHLKVRQVGNSYLYHPVSSMLDTICEAANELLDHTSKETTASLVAHMVKRGKLSGEDIRELYKIIKDHENNENQEE